MSELSKTFKVGQYVTVTRGILCAGGTHDRSWVGSVLEVLAFSWPFCCVQEHVDKYGFRQSRRFSLDIREYEMSTLDPEYVEAMMVKTK